MALIDINSSGAEVPKATIVNDTIKAGTPRRSDMFTAPLTRLSPASSNSTNPTTVNVQSVVDPSGIESQSNIYLRSLQSHRLPKLNLPQDLHFASVNRFTPGTVSLPNIAITAMPTKKRVTILNIIYRPNRA
jgi:hypothetical protein